MTQVRIRSEYDADARVLGDVPFDQLSSVIPTIGRWGLSTDGEVIDTDGLCAQFRYDDDGCYFEVAFS